MIQKRHLQWFGHVCRMDTTRLPFKLPWHQRGRYTTMHRKRPGRNKLKGNLKNCRLTLVDAKICSDWRQVVNWKPIGMKSYEDIVNTIPAKDEKKKSRCSWFNFFPPTFYWLPLRTLESWQESLEAAGKWIQDIKKFDLNLSLHEHNSFLHIMSSMILCFKHAFVF